MSPTADCVPLRAEDHLGLCFHIASGSAKRIGMEPNDLRQEIAVALLRAAPQFQATKGKESSFVGGVAKHVILKILKRRHSPRRPPLTQPDQDEEVWDPVDPRATQPEECLEREEDRDLVEHLLLALPAREREVIVLRFGLGGGHALTQNQVAKRLGVTGSRIGQIVQDALDRLRAHAGVPGPADVDACS
jgi:RNA polymerase sigma factor (sigma-70 family)